MTHRPVMLQQLQLQAGRRSSAAVAGAPEGQA
jgi:hypothetical protein